MVTTKKTEPLTGLDAIAAQADEALQPPPVTDGVTDLDVAEQSAPAVPVMTNAQCILMGLQMVRESLTGFAKLESPKAVLADNVIQGPADAIGEVFDKHGWNLQAAAGDWLPELKAIMVTAPVLLAAWTAIRAEVKAKDAAKGEGQGAAPPPAPKPASTPAPPMAEVIA